MAEFLIDTSMELARNIIFKVMKTMYEESGKQVGKASNAEKVRDLLQPQLDKLEEEIKDLAEGTYKTALSHLHHALVIFGSTFDELSQDSKVNNNLYDKLRLETANGTSLPKTAMKLIEEAYDKAYNAFNYRANLNVGKRAKAMQVAILCIGIQHLDQPKLILNRWDKCMRDVFRDDAVLKCIEQHVTGSRVLKFFRGYKKDDFVQLTILSRDVLKQITRFGAREDVERELVTSIMHRIIQPDELSSELRPLWAAELNWEDATRYIQYREEIHLKNAGSPFDACCILPDGSLTIAQGNDEVVTYSRTLEKLRQAKGSYYDLCYDPDKKCLWGYTKKTNELIQLDPETLEMNGDALPCPTPMGDLSQIDVARWHIAVTESGQIAIAAQLIKKTQIYANDIYLYILRENTEADQQEWVKMDTSGMLRAKVSSLVATDLSEPCTMKIGLAVEDRIFKIEVFLGRETRITDHKALFPNKFLDHMSCAMDEQGRLLVVVRRQFVAIMDSKWEEILAKQFAIRSSGNWIVASQRRIYLATLTSDIEQYEYFIVNCRKRGNIN